MKTITNVPLIKKMKNFMRGIILGAFICFGVAIYLMVSFNIERTPLAYIFSIILLIIAYTLFRIYVLLTGRYGASPRLDERLSIALKGLSSEYSLFNYVFEVPHVLVGKSNIWLLELYEVSGTISYDQNQDKWKFRKGGNAITKFLSSDSFRAPKKDLEFMDKDWKITLSRIEKKSGQNFTSIPIPEKILVFMHSDVEIHAESSGLNLLKGDKLKEYVRNHTNKSDVRSQEIMRLITLMTDFPVS